MARVGVSFEEFCYNHDIVITHHDKLTTKVRGFCYYDGQYYNVVLNSRYSGEQLKQTTIHEIIHVLRDHFSCSIDDAWECERDVDAMIKVMELVFI